MVSGREEVNYYQQIGRASDAISWQLILRHEDWIIVQQHSSHSAFCLTSFWPYTYVGNQTGDTRIMNLFRKFVLIAIKFLRKYLDSNPKWRRLLHDMSNEEEFANLQFDIYDLQSRTNI